MKTLKVRAIKEKIRDRKKWERESKYRDYVSAAKEHNIFCEKIDGKKITVNRSNQALRVYCFAGANGGGCAPRFYNSQLAGIDGSLVVFGADYKSKDWWQVEA